MTLDSLSLSKAADEILTGRVQKIAKCNWDFSVDGGATGLISLQGEEIPAKANVTEVIAREETAVTGATGAKMALYAGGTALMPAQNPTAFADVKSMGLTGSADGVHVASAARLQAQITTAAFYAGKVLFFVKYIEE